MTHFAPIPPGKPSRTGRVVRWVVVLAAAAVASVACLAIVATGTTPPAPSATVPAWTPAHPVAPAVDEQQPDGTLAGDGTYIVGTDVQPGTYRSSGPSDGPSGLCYWARLNSTDGDLDAIITNNVGKGRQVVTIKKTDKAFTSRGCNTWERAA